MNGMFIKKKNNKRGLTCDGRDAQMNGMLTSSQISLLYMIWGCLWVAGMNHEANP